jgi:hypothetical protein
MLCDCLSNFYSLNNEILEKETRECHKKKTSQKRRTMDRFKPVEFRYLLKGVSLIEVSD